MTQPGSATPAARRPECIHDESPRAGTAEPVPDDAAALRVTRGARRLVEDASDAAPEETIEDWVVQVTREVRA